MKETGGDKYEQAKKIRKAFNRANVSMVRSLPDLVSFGIDYSEPLFRSLAELAKGRGVRRVKVIRDDRAWRQESLSEGRRPGLWRASALMNGYSAGFWYRRTGARSAAAVVATRGQPRAMASRHYANTLPGAVTCCDTSISTVGGIHARSIVLAAKR